MKFLSETLKGFSRPWWRGRTDELTDGRRWGHEPTPSL